MALNKRSNIVWKMKWEGKNYSLFLTERENSRASSLKVMLRQAKAEPGRVKNQSINQ